MEYLIPAVLVLLVVLGFVTFLVLNVTRQSGPAATGDDTPPGIGRDETPLGDTSEHAGEHAGQGAAEPDDDAGDADDEPAAPASERLADRPF